MTGAAYVTEAREARVLLVEDDNRVAEAWKRHLDRAGYLPTVVATLDDARRRFDESTWDAVVLDLTLPDGNGEDFARELRGRARGVPIVVASGKLDAERALALAGLAVVALPKPVSGDTLQTAIDRALAGHAEFLHVVADFGAAFGLSARESELLRAAARGLDTEQQSEALGCTVATINTYWHRILLKTHEHSQKGLLVALARFAHDAHTKSTHRTRVVRAPGAGAEKLPLVKTDDE